MNRLRITVCFLALGAMGCAPYRERVLPSLQTTLEAEYGKPLALTPEVKARLDAWTGEQTVAISYDDEGILYVTSAPLGEQVGTLILESAGQGGGAAAWNPYALPFVLLGAGGVGLSGLAGWFAGRRKRAEAVAAELEGKE